jgi:hypothetical protein
MTTIDLTETALPPLTIEPDEAFFILLKARAFDEQTPVSDPDSGSNAADDGAVDALEDEPDATTRRELVAAVSDLNDDAQLDLIALIWIGRGDYALADWKEARLAAADIGRTRLPRYVLGLPLVSDFLDEALSQFGLSFEDYLDRT